MQNIATVTQLNHALHNSLHPSLPCVHIHAHNLATPHFTVLLPIFRPTPHPHPIATINMDFDVTASDSFQCVLYVFAEREDIMCVHMSKASYDHVCVCVYRQKICAETAWSHSFRNC